MTAKSVSHESNLNLSNEQITKIIELGGNSIVGDMLDDNFATDINKCNKFFIYNDCRFVATVDRNINVL